uniref:Uncharacterized protein n=1 Tax=viral metagenome TaxID=1070528 RepID=A0A6M3X6B7_9ZZZZ
MVMIELTASDAIDIKYKYHAQEKNTQIRLDEFNRIEMDEYSKHLFRHSFMVYNHNLERCSRIIKAIDDAIADMKEIKISKNHTRFTISMEDTSE